jgi:hypothetical protein
MKTKTLMISGLAFEAKYFPSNSWLSFLNSGETVDMERLQKRAQEGWLVTRFRGFSYVLQEAPPQTLQFAIDYKDHPDPEYFELFEAAGWSHVDSLAYIHLFKAPLDAPPLMTDVQSRIDVLRQEVQRYRRKTLIPSLLFICALVLPYLPISAVLPWYVEPLTFILFWSYFIFHALPLISYWSRLRKLTA